MTYTSWSHLWSISVLKPRLNISFGIFHQKRITNKHYPCQFNLNLYVCSMDLGGLNIFLCQNKFFQNESFASELHPWPSETWYKVCHPAWTHVTRGLPSPVLPFPKLDLLVWCLENMTKSIPPKKWWFKYGDLKSPWYNLLKNLHRINKSKQTPVSRLPFERIHHPKRRNHRWIQILLVRCGECSTNSKNLRMAKDGPPNSFCGSWVLNLTWKL